MTEWEQIKKEYRDIPIPADGPHQMLQAMAKAKRKRNRVKNFARYGTVAAAALLVVLLVPGMLLFSGGFGAAEDSAYMQEADCAVQSTGSAGNWMSKDGAERVPIAPAADTAAGSANTAVTEEKLEYGLESDSVLSDKQTENTEKAQEPADDYLALKNREAISEEILRQMEERMQKNGETYYIRSEEYPEGFSQISEEQEYYINEAGLLVFVFRAGTVAPEEQGNVEFIIPAEVAAP